MLARTNRHAWLLKQCRRHLTGTAAPTDGTFLHIGPSGDCWTGTSLFAAKHLTPDYVKSIPLLSLDEDSITRLLDLLQEEPEWCHEMYDTQTIPLEVMARVTQADGPKDKSATHKNELT